MAAADRSFDSGCRRCARLVRHLAAIRRIHPGYHCRPVAPLGRIGSALLIVGLAPGLHGANRTGRPFTGDHAGILLFKTLHAQGFASRAESVAANDSLELIGCRITNAVKCLPPANKPLPAEVRRCNDYLAADLAAVPAGGVVLALGAVAHGAILIALGLRPRSARFAHGAEHQLPARRILLDSYHCSRYNTRTRRLTEAMFQGVIARARHLLGHRATDTMRG